MKISRARVFRYELPLSKPLTAKENTEKTRVGLLLELKSENKMLAYSEIAPLPGLHLENLEEATRQLQDFLPSVMASTLTEQDVWNLSTTGISLYPSVCMGVDLGLLQLWAKLQGLPLYRYLNTPGTCLIRLRALIDPIHDGDVVKVALAYVLQGYQAIKLKIGRMPYKEEILMVEKVRQAVGAAIEICLDANRNLDLNHAIELGKALMPCKIAYIEEPIWDPEHLLEFYRAAQIPVALDETWLEKPLDALLKKKEAIFALVVKPGLVGGIKRFVQVFSWMQMEGIVPIVTSAFESGVGLSLWAQLLVLDNKCNEAHGLGTFSWFKEDILLPPFRAFRGLVDVAQVEKNLATFSIQENKSCQLVFMCEDS
jgi:o-succinylbenzoate synthase